MSKWLFLLFFPFLLTSKELSQMTLREKIGQLLIATIDAHELSEENIQFFEETALGNIILFPKTNALTSQEQIAKLTAQIIASIQNSTGITPFIAIDHEGGAVVRLKHNFTFFPGNGALGKVNSPSLAFATGLITAQELSSVGINTFLGPVVDVNTNSQNPVIGIRSFGNTPEKVTIFAREMLRGLHMGGMITAIKHFPGHGDTTLDSHFSLPINYKTLSELHLEELAPFYSLKEETDCIMTAHVLYPAIDPDHPATLSSPLLRTLLRDQWKFSGVVISDSLTMSGLYRDGNSFETIKENIAKKAVESLLAGCDLLLLVPDPRVFKMTPAQNCELIKAVLEEIHLSTKKGILSPSDIDDSCTRILSLKEKLSSPLPLPSKTPHPIADLISSRALTLLTNPEIASQLLPFSTPLTIVAPHSIAEEIDIALPSSRVHLLPFPLSKKERLLVQNTLSPPLLFLSYKASSDPEQLLLLEHLASILDGHELIIAGLHNPTDVDNPLFTTKHLTYQTYSPSPSSLKVLMQTLTKPLGKKKSASKEAPIRTEQDSNL